MSSKALSKKYVLDFSNNNNASKEWKFAVICYNPGDKMRMLKSESLEDD